MKLNECEVPGLISRMGSVFCAILILAMAQAAQAQWTTSGSNTTTTNNVGVGTSSPDAKLQVEQSTSGFGSTVVASFFSPDTVGGGTRGIQILGTGAGTS